jgi:hypothetical protein
VYRRGLPGDWGPSGCAHCAVCYPQSAGGRIPPYSAFPEWQPDVPSWNVHASSCRRARSSSVPGFRRAPGCAEALRNRTQESGAGAGVGWARRVARAAAGTRGGNAVRPSGKGRSLNGDIAPRAVPAIIFVRGSEFYSRASVCFARRFSRRADRGSKIRLSPILALAPRLQDGGYHAQLASGATEPAPVSPHLDTGVRPLGRPGRDAAICSAAPRVPSFQGSCLGGSPWVAPSLPRFGNGTGLPFSDTLDVPKDCTFPTRRPMMVGQAGKLPAEGIKPRGKERHMSNERSSIHARLHWPSGHSGSWSGRERP